MKLFIKNAVSLGNLRVVRDELERLGLPTVSVEMGEINAPEELTHLQYGQLRLVLQQAGIEIFEDKRDILVRRIKSIILDVVHHIEQPLIYNLSAHLAEELHHDYAYLSNLFSETQHITIEKFFICHKIERVKKYLLYERMGMTEIAHKMHYSSLAHLCSQFKKVTGMTASQFKEQYGNGDLPTENC